MAAPSPRPTEPAGEHDDARWFIALRPAPPARLALHRVAQSLAARFGGRPVSADDAHLTLAFIGEAPRALERPMRDVVASLPGCDALVLDRLGSFDGRLLWIGPAEDPPWLATVAQAVREGLTAIGAPFDRKRFVPHLTLVRRARPAGPGAIAQASRALQAIDCAPMGVSLVESVLQPGGSRYRYVD
jgi:2'-5' RNA ligase